MEEAEVCCTKKLILASKLTVKKIVCPGCVAQFPGQYPIITVGHKTVSSVDQQTTAVTFNV